MSINLSNVKSIHIPAYYTCTGAETGICEATFDNKLYRIYINSATAGSRIMYLNGHFYVVSGSVDITQPQAQTNTEDTTPTPNEPGEGSVTDPDTGSTRSMYFTTPNVTTLLGESILYHFEVDQSGVAHAYYRKSSETQWIEIPILTDEDIVRLENNVSIVSANIQQDGSTVHLT